MIYNLNYPERVTLSAEERDALDDSLSETGCYGFRGDHPDLYAAAERILAARLAEAWDEGFSDGFRQDAEGDDGPRFSNPYRNE